jgi:alcohol dehydrogenase
MVLDRRSLIHVPSDLPIDIAAIFGCAFLTGVGAVRNGANVPAGASVGIWGLGGVGMAALLGAVVAKASPIIAIDPVPMKRALALELGADIAIDPTEDIREHVKGGVEYAIEAVGKASALKHAYESTARAGTTVTVGLPAPADQLSFSAVSLVTDVKTLKGSYLGSGDPRKDIPEFVQLWRDGKLPAEKLITKTRPLTEVNESMDELDDAQKVVRQIVQPH